MAVPAAAAIMPAMAMMGVMDGNRREELDNARQSNEKLMEFLDRCQRDSRQELQQAHEQHRREVEDLRAAHARELAEARTLHSSDAAAKDAALRELRDHMEAEKTQLLAERERAFRADMDFLRNQHASQMAMLREEKQGEIDRMRAHLQDTIQRMNEDRQRVEQVHGSHLDFVKSKQEEEKKDHESNLQTLKNEYRVREERTETRYDEQISLERSARKEEVGRLHDLHLDEVGRMEGARREEVQRLVADKQEQMDAMKGVLKNQQDFMVENQRGLFQMVNKQGDQITQMSAFQQSMVTDLLQRQLDNGLPSALGGGEARPVGASNSVPKLHPGLGADPSQLGFSHLTSRKN